MIPTIGPHITRTVVGLFALLVAALPGQAQQGPAPARQNPASSPDHELLTYFYKDPRPERLNGFLAQFQDTPVAEQPQAFLALSGFFAAVCVAHPDQFPRMVPADLKPKTAAAISAAVRMCGNERVAAALKSTLERSAPDKQTRAAISSLPRLSELRVTQPTHLDILWSASFATANLAYVRPIYNFYVAATAQPGVDVRDIVAIVMLKHRPNKEAMDAISAKYPRDTLIRIIYAASALWSLDSNVRQHTFVATALSGYEKEAAGSVAVQGLAETRKAIDAAIGSRR
jgi:hypothetical protein